MNPKQLSKLSDEELLNYSKTLKPSPWFDAFFIGFMVGILIFGAVANAWGFAMIVPLFLIYLFLKKPKHYKAMKAELKKRNLEQ
jgi:hypothetical protein